MIYQNQISNNSMPLLVPKSHCLRSTLSSDPTTKALLKMLIFRRTFTKPPKRSSLMRVMTSMYKVRCHTIKRMTMRRSRLMFWRSSGSKSLEIKKMILTSLGMCKKRLVRWKKRRVNALILMLLMSVINARRRMMSSTFRKEQPLRGRLLGFTLPTWLLTWK